MNITLPIITFLNGSSLLDLWSATKISFGIIEGNVKIIDEESTLQVFYPKSSYSPSKLPTGGVGIFSSPQEIFMSEHVVLNYQLRFDESFQPIHGGKLPGLFLSKNRFETTGSIDGENDSNSASVRLAWKSDFNGEVYVYLPKNNQSPEYYKLPGFHSNGKYGDSLWKNEIKFDKINWNNITLEIKLNTIENGIPQQNGLLFVQINNSSYSFDKIVFRKKKEVQLSSFLFNTFFGGSTEKYATPNDTYTYFKNITLEKKD
jgi:hypothetical protein